MRRRGAQALVLEYPAPPVEDDIVAAGMPSPGVVFRAVLLHEALDIGLGHVIDELNLAGAQRRQADRVLPLGFHDDLVQVGQAMALGIGLPVVLKAHQPGLAIARPGDELEGTRANRMFGGRLEGVRSHQDNRVAHDTYW